MPSQPRPNRQKLTVMNDFANWIGYLVITAAFGLIWVIGAIAGSDYFSKNISKRAGDWFGIVWFIGLPAMLFAFVMLS